MEAARHAAYITSALSHSLDQTLLFRQRRCFSVFLETQARDSRTMTGKQYLLPQMTIIDGIPAYRSPNIKEYFY